jgi:hypothetical protein
MAAVKGEMAMSEHRSDIVIHIDEALQDDMIHAVERDLSAQEGVYSACTNDRARHLMLVDYDPRALQATDLLHRVREHGLSAELIGL